MIIYAEVQINGRLYLCINSANFRMNKPRHNTKRILIRYRKKELMLSRYFPQVNGNYP